MAVNREAPRSERGFTLAEVMVYSFLLVLILAGLYTLLGGALRSWQAEDDLVEVQQNARLAVDRVVSEIRGAKSVVDDATYDSTPNAIYLWVDEDVDGVVDGGETRLFSYDSGNKRLRYGLGGNSQLADYVEPIPPATGSIFTYYQGATSIAVDEERANRIAIEFRIVKGDFSKNYKSSVQLRNKNL
ncbi:MAG: prepilin-type N-terminal cleavage/methylation domain-containing protein [Actinomycetota bacterium]|nr:prepilin-type N-terminal cleavage/methylation domain-containing protein [Actinomycetota bacterium]